MELVTEVTTSTCFIGKEREMKMKMKMKGRKRIEAVGEKETSSYCVGASYLALPPQSTCKAKLLPAHHIAFTLFFPQGWGPTACSCQGGLL